MTAPLKPSQAKIESSTRGAKPIFRQLMTAPLKHELDGLRAERDELRAIFRQLMTAPLKLLVSRVLDADRGAHFPSANDGLIEASRN